MDDALQPVDADPMMDFDERDLLRFAEAAGFGEIHLELQVAIKPRSEPEPWETFLRAAPNPKVPTIEEAVNQTLTPAETEEVYTHLPPLVEAGRDVNRLAIAYLWATRL